MNNNDERLYSPDEVLKVQELAAALQKEHDSAVELMEQSMDNNQYLTKGDIEESLSGFPAHIISKALTSLDDNNPGDTLPGALKKCPCGTMARFGVEASNVMVKKHESMLKGIEINKKYPLKFDGVDYGLGLACVGLVSTNFVLVISMIFCNLSGFAKYPSLWYCLSLSILAGIFGTYKYRQSYLKSFAENNMIALTESKKLLMEKTEIVTHRCLKPGVFILFRDGRLGYCIGTIVEVNAEQVSVWVDCEGVSLEPDTRPVALVDIVCSLVLGGEIKAGKDSFIPPMKVLDMVRVESADTGLSPSVGFLGKARGRQAHS